MEISDPEKDKDDSKVKTLFTRSAASPVSYFMISFLGIFTS